MPSLPTNFGLLPPELSDPKKSPVAILPVHGKEGGDAIRVIVQAVKGGRAPLSLLAPLVLNGRDNRPTAEAEKLMRGLGPSALVTRRGGDPV